MRALVLSIVTWMAAGCALDRSPIIDDRDPDGGGLDAPRPDLDAPGQDVPIVDPDVPPADAPDPCAICPSGTRCMTGMVCECDPALCGTVGECVSGACVVCGGIGEPCCTSDRCRAGGTCGPGATCEMASTGCGRMGEPCCDGVTCSSRTECIGGTCVDEGGSCGGPGEDCCGGGACITGTSCQVDGLFSTGCLECGRNRQPCCPFGMACSEGSCMESWFGARYCGT